jgi:hypothetical protein
VSRQRNKPAITLRRDSCGAPLYQQTRFDLFRVLTCNLLALASFGGAPYGLDEAGIMKCLFQPGYAVGARMHVADETSVDLSHVDRRTHEPTGNRGRLGWHECDV